MDDFLNTLRAHKIIRVLDFEKEDGSEASKVFSVGGLGIDLHLPKKYIHPNLEDFAVEELPKHFISVYLESFSNYGMSDGNVLIRTDELIILQRENRYIFDYKDHQYVKELIYDYVEKTAYIHLTKDGDEERIREEIFMGIRNAFLIYAAKHNRFAIHSASMLYKDKVWLFSAHSGGGKSTHVSLWKDLFKVSDVNGDLNLLAMEENRAVVYGLPWCGTSGIYRTGRYPLGGIVFLSQGDKEELLPFAKGEKPLYIMQRMISPAWTKEMMEKNLDMGKRLASSGIGLWKLSCTKNKSAAEFMKKEIDQWNS